MQNVCRCELFVVIHKNHSTGKPLSIQFSPYSFSPSGIGDSQMNALLVQVMPVDTCHQMTKRIRKVVCHHFRFAACSAGEIHQHRIAVVVDMFRAYKLRRLFPLVMEIMESFAGIRTDTDDDLYGRTFWKCILDMIEDDILTITDDSLDAGTFITVDDIFICLKMRGGNGYRANLM